MKNPGKYTVIMIIAVLLTGLNVFAALRLYRHAAKPAELSGSSANSFAVQSPEVVVNDIKTMLTQTALRKNSYQLIADKNLFSVQRTNWKKPVEEEEPPEVVTTALRTDVVLSGTLQLGDKRGAMLEFISYSPQNRKRTLFAGDSVSPEAGNKSRSYTLLKVEPTVVTLKDSQGIVFNIALHSLGKLSKKSAAAPEPKTSISVGVDKSVPGTSSTVVGSSFSEQAGKTAQKRASEVRLEQQVEAGQLREVKTPFGSAYVKEPAGGTNKSDQK